VGLIGMTGIIINNAIVLITTVEQHGRGMATVPAVIAAAGDRLRPILLTSLTTVLGLAPLVFERSQQALFLKPTVVTLVYGLGVGAILVLIIVPALLVIESDVRMQIRSWCRAIGPREGGPSGVVRGATLAGLVWLAATFGPLLVTGAPVGPAAWVVQALPGVSAARAAFATLFAGLLVIVLVAMPVLARRVRS